MNIPIPKNMKSPTVIIVGQETDEKHNQIAMRRMDNLERKLDQQYKAFIDKSDYSKVLEKMQSSFMSNFNKMLDMNKSMITQRNKERIDILRDEFTRKIKSIEEKDNNEELKLFTSKLNSLENAIKNITLKPTVVKVPSSNNKVLFDSFNGIFKRMEELIRSSRPRLIPSPS
jgi:hypothetical protein